MAGHPSASLPLRRPDPYYAALVRALLAKPLKGRPGSIEAVYVLHFGNLETPDDLVSGGVLVLEAERVFGGDSGYYYRGSYELHGETLRVNAKVERHNPGWLNVWDDYERKFEIQFEGRRGDGGSLIEGRMRRPDMPNVSLPMKWFRMADLP
jgi:T3SS negative regulator,GrlR